MGETRYANLTAEAKAELRAKFAKLHETSGGKATLAEYADWGAVSEPTARKYLREMGIAWATAASDPPEGREEEPSLLETAQENGVNIQSETPLQGTDPLVINVAQQTGHLSQRVRSLEKRTPPPGRGRKGRLQQAGGDWTAEARQEVAGVVASSHVEMISELAEEADTYITACGQIVWKRWQESGYRSEFPNPKTGPMDYLSVALDFFSEARNRVAELYDRIEDLEEELSLARQQIARMREERQSEEKFFHAILTLKAAGATLNTEEFRALHHYLQEGRLGEMGR